MLIFFLYDCEVRMQPVSGGGVVSQAVWGGPRTWTLLCPDSPQVYNQNFQLIALYDKKKMYFGLDFSLQSILYQTTTTFKYLKS